jgi:hypothetical protein
LRGEDGDHASFDVDGYLIRSIDDLRIDHDHLLVRDLLNKGHVDDVVDDDVVLDDHWADVGRGLEQIGHVSAKYDGNIQLQVEKLLGRNEYPSVPRRLSRFRIDVNDEAIFSGS